MFVFVPQAAGHTHNSMSDPTGDAGSQPLSQTPDAQPPDTSFEVNGVTVQPIGAGTKRKKQTSSIWKHVVAFTPATRGGKNVKCMVKIIPGLGKVLRDLDALTAERKSNKGAAVNAKNAAAGPTRMFPLFQFRRKMRVQTRQETFVRVHFFIFPLDAFMYPFFLFFFYYFV